MDQIKRSYSELSLRTDLVGRFRYLMLGGGVGHETFGNDRYLNQRFYASRGWKSVRDAVIIRDNGCDLGIPGYPIHDGIYVHHMNPIQVDDLIEFNPEVIDPEYLISVTLNTHNAIHFGDESLLPREPVDRRPGDTIGWRREW